MQTGRWLKFAMLMLGMATAMTATVLAEGKDRGHKEKSKEEKVALSDLPAAVQAAIQAKAEGGTVGEIEKETKGSKVAYEAKVTDKDGKKIEVVVAEDGTVLKVEDDDEEQAEENKDDAKGKGKE